MVLVPKKQFSNNSKDELIKTKFADPKFDFTFKKLFAREENSDLLIDFINKLIPEKKIINIEYLPPNIDPEIFI